MDRPAVTPRLMTLPTAAAYCDMSAGQFERQCPVAPIDYGWRGRRWRREDLDRWIDSMAPKLTGSQGVQVDAAGTTSTDPQPLTAESRRRASLARLP
jgi:hypothetical protein